MKNQDERIIALTACGLDMADRLARSHALLKMLFDMLGDPELSPEDKGQCVVEAKRKFLEMHHGFLKEYSNGKPFAAADPNLIGKS